MCPSRFAFLCVYIRVCIWLTFRAAVSQPNERRHGLSAEMPSVAMTHLRECDHQRQQPPLPASRPDTHTDIHTHADTPDVVWGYGCPSDLSLFNNIRGCAEGGGAD